MSTRTKIGLIIAAAAGGLAILLLGGVLPRTSAQPVNIYTFTTMGTEASFVFSGAAPAAVLQANEAGTAAFDRVTRAANLYDKNSELSRLNASAYEREFICSPLLWTMIEEAAFAYYFSGGSFDITVKPLMDLWGFYRKRGSAPTPAEIVEVSRKVGFSKLRLDRSRRAIRFTVRGMGLDLGGIAKGFALDLAEKEVRKTVAAGFLNLGGNLKFLPRAPKGKKHYLTGIKDPKNPAELKEVINVYPGEAVSTSGDYERFVTYGSRQYGHIMDPKLGFPPRKNWSATVIAPTAMRADWLSTAVFLNGKKLADKVKKELSGCKVILVEK